MGMTAGSPQDVMTQQTVKDVFGVDSVLGADPVSGLPAVLPRGKSKVNPASVSFTSPAPRINSGVPSPASKRLMALETGG